MSSQIDKLLEDARLLTRELDGAEFQSEKWYARNNVACFLREIEERPNPNGLYRAAHALRHFIVDQFDWSADYCKKASELCQRADNIRKGIERKQS